MTMVKCPSCDSGPCRCPSGPHAAAPPRYGVYEEIAKELAYQAQRWGHTVDDTKNTPNDFVAYISHYATRWFNGGFAPYSHMAVDAYRKQMIKVAALAIAAVQSLDRQRAARGKAFFEKDI